MISKEIKHLIYVVANSYHFTEFEKVNYNMECLIFDTESCQKIEGDNTGAKVYGWGLGCTRSNKMIYGNTISEYIDTMINLFNNYVNSNSKYLVQKEKRGYPSYKFIKLPVAVHNLAWDVEFFKYSLAEKGFKYLEGIVKEQDGKNYATCVNVEEENSYHIIQSDGIVYGASLYCPFTCEIENKDGSITNVGLCIDMFDSYKIISTSESDFHCYVKDINPMFHKIVGQYDYEKFRENNHIHTPLELRYQYNDIFMLRVTIEQFYIDGLMDGKMPSMGCRTASSIAFKKLKEITWGKTKTEQQYENYFEINLKTKFEPLRLELEKESYTGGFTHANKKYLTKHLKNINGCSLDINSSYPSQMAYKKFPKGKPQLYEWGCLPVLNDEQVALYEIGFDFVKPKKKEYDLAIFKIGSTNIKQLVEIVGNVSGQEYFSTNITKDNRVIPVFKETGELSQLKCNYKMVVTNMEYDFLVKHFDFGVFDNDDLGFPIYDNIEFSGLELGDVLIYKADIGMFRNFVEFYTQLKIDSKNTDNIPMANQAKLILNSSYGKFGTRQEKIEQVLQVNEYGIYTFSNDNAVPYKGKEFYRPYASFVTSYGRLQLWNTIIYAVGVDQFLYTDTDSIYTLCNKETMIKNMEKIGEIVDKTKLGAWDVETEFKEFKVLGQKKYMYTAKKVNKETNEVTWYTNLKCCGLPKIARDRIVKNVIDIDQFKGKIISHNIVNVKSIKKKVMSPYDNFFLGKKVKGKLQKKKVIGGCLLLDVLFQIKRVMW